jgi:PQQ system protein
MLDWLHHDMAKDRQRFAEHLERSQEEVLMPRLWSRYVLSGCAAGLIGLTGCDYVRLFRPSVLKQLNPDVVRLVNMFPAVDQPNEAILGRLFAHGGLSHATLGSDGVFRDKIWAPENEFIWKPAIIHIPRGGELELEFHNTDHNLHGAFVPSEQGRQAMMLPMHTEGKMRIRLDSPGLYWFGCPISNHAGRGMLGLIMVGGEVPPEAKLDRPKQERP